MSLTRKTESDREESGRADGSPGRKCHAHAEGGGLQPAPFVAAHQHSDEDEKGRTNPNGFKRLAATRMSY